MDAQGGGEIHPWIPKRSRISLADYSELGIFRGRVFRSSTATSTIATKEKSPESLLRKCRRSRSCEPAGSYPNFASTERTLATCLTACLQQLMRSHVEGISRSLDGASALDHEIIRRLGRSDDRIQGTPCQLPCRGPAAAVVGCCLPGSTDGDPRISLASIWAARRQTSRWSGDGDYQLTRRGEIAGFPLEGAR